MFVHTAGVQPMPPGDIYARVFENSQTGLLLLDRETGRILEANAAFLRMAGRGSCEVIGRSFWEPPLAADMDAGAEIHGHLLAGRTVIGAELPLKTSDGHWLLLEVSASNAAPGFIQLEVRDATGHEQARLAERIERLRLPAKRAAAEFHKLQRVLSTTGDLLSVGAAQGRPILHELEEIQQASGRAGAITEQLLAFGGGSAPQIQPVALNDLVESMLPSLRQLLDQAIEIEVDLSPDMAPVMADPMQVRQIVLKLAANSGEAMGCSGAFCLRTGNAPTLDPAPGNYATANGPYGMLAVSDTGPGFDDQSWAHLYEPFFSTKVNGQSLGLGLAAVWGLVRQNGGRLWACSQPAQGATFRIYFPLADAHFPAPAAAQADPSRGNATILLVEAHDGMRTVMANLLKKRGYRVLAALHTKEALRGIQAQGPPDLLISRPEPELAMHLTGMYPQLRVLYLGGSADGSAAYDRLPLRISMLRKPFEPESLLAKVKELLSQPL
jgi:two-component system, cell cycle sensor histidine kinase and response regulator CckA